MTQAMRKYSDYRASGDDWLGKIPIHWRSTSLGAISKRKSSRNRPDLPLLSVLREKGVVLRSSLSQDENHNFIPDNLNNYQFACEGDLVVNKMKAWQGSVGIAPQNGIVSPAYYIFELTEIKKKYAHRLLRSRLYADFFGRASDGIRIGQWDLGIPAMKRIPVVIPPPEEQDAIASYLDEMDRHIARFIRNRRRLIEVLNEQKQAIINRAVTRGLDPDVSLKPSGINWLGDIPEHWEMKSLRQLGYFTKGSGGSREDDVSEGVPCIRYGHIYMYFNFSAPTPRSYVSNSRACDYSRSKYGDILFTASGEDMWEIGKSVVNLIEGEVCCGGDVIILRPMIDAHSRFLGYASDAWHVKCQKSRLGRGTTIKHIYRDQLKKVCIAIPPKTEQFEIAEYIEKTTAAATLLIDRAQREIDLVREYRTRLIADVVTGKVDVRHLAPAPGREDLGEVVESLEPLEKDIADAVIDNEEPVNDAD